MLQYEIEKEYGEKQNYSSNLNCSSLHSDGDSYPNSPINGKNDKNVKDAQVLWNVDAVQLLFLWLLLKQVLQFEPIDWEVDNDSPLGDVGLIVNTIT